MSSESESPVRSDEHTQGPEETATQQSGGGPSGNEETDTAAVPRTDRHDRGRTIIDDRVRKRLVERAALSVPGSVRDRAIASKSLPSSHFDGRDNTRVQVDVAARWPVDSSQLVADVATAVGDELERSLGERPESTLVHIARITNDPSADTAVTRLADADGSRPAEIADGPLDSEDRGLIPRRVAGVTYIAVPVLLAILALGIIAVRDTTVALGWVGGSAWIDPVVQYADQIRWVWWTWPAVIAAMIVGLVLVITAIKPRKKSYVSIADDIYVSKRLARELSTEAGGES